MLGTPGRTKRLTRALGAALGVALLIGCGIGQARAEDDEPLDTKLIKNFLRGLGLRDGTEAEINYRERSPLVVPPTRELPAPESGVAPRNPAWPVDADEKKRRAAAATRDRRVISPEEAGRALRPDELDKGRVAPAAENKRVTTPEESGRPLPPSALGSKSLIDLFRGSDAEEKGTFVTEPPRNTLIQPPVGYRTPSPSQPYGVGTKAAPKKPATLEDRVSGESK